MRDPRRWWQFAFIVTAEKDGDVAYTASDWNEGVTPWEFALPFSLEEAEPLLRGTVFSDRGVYRLGEEVHFKAVLRHNTPEGIRLLPSGTTSTSRFVTAAIVCVDERTVKVNAWSSGEWTFTLPEGGALGNYAVRAVLAADRKQPGAKPDRDVSGGEEEELDQVEDDVPWNKTVRGSFLVAAYRKPDFRVDVTLTGTTMLAGDPLQGVVTGALPVRRADAQAADALDLHENAALVGARRHSRQVSRRAMDVCRLERQPAASAYRHGVRRRAAGGEWTVAALVGH